MAKKKEEKLAERLERIKILEKQRDDITRELEVLIGLREPEKPAQPPEGYEQGKEIVEIVRSAGRPMTTPDIVKAIFKKWDYKVNASSVRTSGKFVAKTYKDRLVYENTKLTAPKPKVEPYIDGPRIE